MTKPNKQKLKKIALFLLYDIGMFAAVAAVVTVMNLVFGKSCPSQLIFNFDCPFCGMTRAHLAALRLDFAEAFSRHPLFFLGLPYLYLLFHEEFFMRRWKKPYLITVITMTALLLVRYAIHLILIFT